jgi:hypothetical protein
MGFRENKITNIIFRASISEGAIFEEAFIINWNILINNRDEIMARWEAHTEFGNTLGAIQNMVLAKHSKLQRVYY